MIKAEKCLFPHNTVRNREGQTFWSLPHCIFIGNELVFALIPSKRLPSIFNILIALENYLLFFGCALDKSFLSRNWRLEN